MCLPILGLEVSQETVDLSIYRMSENRGPYNLLSTLYLVITPRGSVGCPVLEQGMNRKSMQL